MNTIHINNEIEKQYGEDIRNYLFMHTINGKNFIPAEIIRIFSNLYEDFYNDNYPIADLNNSNDSSFKNRIHYLLAEDTYFEQLKRIQLNYAYKTLDYLLGDFHVPSAKNTYPYYNYAQTVTTATYLLTLANHTLKATPKKLSNLADNCYRLLLYQKWIENTFLYKSAVVTEYLRARLCCGNSKQFTTSLLNWFDYMEILEFRILPHACSKAMEKFNNDNCNSKIKKAPSSINNLAKTLYQALTHLLSQSYYKKHEEYSAATSATSVVTSNTTREKKQRRSRLPVIEEGFLNNTTTMALWNLRKKIFPEAVIIDSYEPKTDYNYLTDEETYKKIVQRYKTILDKDSLPPEEIITDTRIIISTRKNYSSFISGSSTNTNRSIQCIFSTTEELDHLFVDFCSASLNTVIKLLENETGTDYYDVIQLYYLIKNEVENICLDDTPSKPLYTKQLADIEDNYLQFIRTKLIQVLEERNIPDTRAFILDLSLFDTVNSLELAETLLSCDPAKVDNDLLVDCCQFICHFSTKASTESYCSISNQVCCIAFTSSGSLPKAPLSRITSFRNYNDLDETEHEIIKIYANMIYNDLTDIHRQIADIFINYPI